MDSLDPVASHHQRVVALSPSLSVILSVSDTHAQTGTQSQF